MNIDWTIVLSHIVVFLSGSILSPFGKGWVNDLFERKKELRNKLDKPYHLISDLIAEATSNSYKHNPSKELKEKAFKAAARIEALGKRDLALDIRQFVNYWQLYFDVTQRLQIDSTAIYKELVMMQMRLRVDLDNLDDFLMEALAKDYVLFPNYWLKLKRVYSKISIRVKKKFIS